LGKGLPRGREGRFFHLILLRGEKAGVPPLIGEKKKGSSFGGLQSDAPTIPRREVSLFSRGEEKKGRAFWLGKKGKASCSSSRLAALFVGKKGGLLA